MKRSILFVFGLLLVNSNISAQSSMYYETEQSHQEDELNRLEQQEVEEAPSSTPIGGSRGGQLEIEKEQDDAKTQHDLEKQQQLYEQDGYYRRGL